MLNVPKLRFGEFEGEWVEKRLDAICKIERGRFSPRPRNNPIYYNGNIPFVQTSDIVKAKGRILNYSQTLNEKGLKVSKKFNKGTILITIAANIGYAGVLEIDMACPDSLIGLTVKDENSNYFINYLLEIEQPRMEYLAIDNAQKNINIEFLKPYKLNLPQKQEQQIIANFLTSIDQKINQLTQKKTLLESYKKGVMQKIFSQELRFNRDDGGAFEDWEEKRLGEISECLDNLRKPLNSEERQSIQGDIPYWGANNIMDYINDYLFDETIILLAEDGGNFNEFKTRPIANISYGKCWVNNHTHVLRQINGISNNEFLFYSLVHKNITGYISGGTRAKLIKSEMLKIKINLPSVPEQQKISNFLTSLDQKITQTTQQIEAMKSFKKGLLQEMFV